MTLGACLFDRAQVQECLAGVRVRAVAEAASAEAGVPDGAEQADPEGGPISAEEEHASEG